MTPDLKNLTIETTRACNLRCVHCAVSHPNYKIHTLSWEAFEQILPILKRHRPFVNLSGHGETFLNKHFMRMLDKVVELGCPVCFQTNATLLTSELSAQLLDYAGPNRLRTFTISIDAAEKELFEKIRVRASYEEFLHNIRTFQRMKRARGLRYPTVLFEMVAMLMNVHQVPDVVRIVHDLGGESLMISDLQEYDNVRGQRIDRDLDYALPLIFKAAKVAEELDVDFATLPSIEQHLKRSRCNDAEGRDDVLVGETASKMGTDSAVPEGMVRVKDCNDPWSFAMVQSTGDVLPCCWISKPMGNVGVTPFPDIWSSPQYEELREAVAGPNPPEPCKTCYARGWKTVPSDMEPQ